MAALLDAGQRVFALRGYGAATMTEIAAMAGAPIGSLYQFFPNKGAIGGAVLTRAVAGFYAALDGLRERAFTPATLADALVDAMAPLNDGRAVATVLTTDGLPLPAGLPDGGSVRDGLRDRIAGLLRAAAPQIDEARAAQVAVMVLQMSKSTVRLPGAAPEVPGLDDALRALLRAALPVWLAQPGVAGDQA